ncbi:MAG: fumarylacetoacetate hydrolase family protein [Pseudomonadota bacterium]|nr:fumarylacetoacetate hydrolase family protein [Pseudomonadota bacterium]
MKLLTIDVPRGGRPGVLTGDGDVLDLLGAVDGETIAQWLPSSVRGILEASDDGLDAVRRVLDGVESSTSEQDRLRETGALRAFDETALLAAIPDPHLILSEGLNYHSHLMEMSNTPAPEYPTAFIKVQSSLTGSGKPIIVPPQCPDMIDFEGELTVVIGQHCHRVSEADALNHVAGYTIVNDVSARDWIPGFMAAENKFGTILGWERNIMGKNLPSFSPCGPVMATSDEIPDPHDLQITTTLNGEVMQSVKTDDMVHGVAQMISYFSQWYQLQPGDMLTTGSPAGVGFGRDPKVFMKAGDLIEVEISKIGKLSNRLVAQE